MNVQGRFALPDDRVEEQDKREGLDLRQLQDFVWRRWKLVVATALAVMVIAFFIILMVTPRYTATVQILLDPKKNEVFGAESLLPELNLDSGNVDSQISVIQSTNLLRHVVEQQKLTDDAEFGGAGKP